MIRTQPTTLLLCASLLMTLAGCANKVARQVTDNNRDTSGRYDGQWLVHTLPAATIQNIEQWRFRCDNMEGQFTVRVEDGKLYAISDFDNRPHTTNINSKGEFRLLMPSASKVKEGARASASVYGGDVTYIVQGSLAGEKPSGYLTTGVAQFGNNGCTTGVRFELQAGKQA